jgi:serine/threonine protein kinase
MFNPTLTTTLEIDGKQFRFAPHPVVPSIPWGQEGRHAVVFRLNQNGRAYALKVFRPVFRHPGLIEAAEALSFYQDLPGMEVCQQIVITPETHPKLVEKYEDLDHAMLMPWMEGYTWFDLLQEKAAISLEGSRALAESMAWVLYTLETNHLAHCDLSSGNVIVNPDRVNIHLIDVEDLYSPWLEIPPYVPAGSMGYQHQEVSRTGQWGPLGDRFAGAVLMAEMLGWAHPMIREAAWGESYFAPDEMQKDSERYRLLIDTIKLYDMGFIETFEAAWRSRKLEDCPPLRTWYDLLDGLPRDPVIEWAPINPAEFTVREPEPEPERVKAAPKAPPRPEPRPVFQPEPIPVQAPAQPARKGRSGCRTFALTAMVISLLLCYAGFLAAQIALLPELFPVN